MIQKCAQLFVLFLALLPLSAQAKEPGVRRFALVIGNNRPDQGPAQNLRYADDDAVSTHRLLREAGAHSLLLVSLDSDSRALFADAQVYGRAARAELERAYASLLARMQEAGSQGFETEFLLFYSGHGDVDRGEGYLALEDGRLTRSMLFELLSRSTATRNHVFIDACKSYFLAFDRGPGGRRTRYAGALVAGVPAELANTGFVLSTSSDRESHEWERFQGGILSHELRSALRGAADTNLDARISYKELGSFLTAANQGIKNPRFRPDFMVRPPEKNFAQDVLSWGGSRTPVSFAGARLGHFYLETADGERLLDAHPAPNQVLKLWMPDVRPLFVRSHDGNAEFVLTTHEPVQVAELAPAHVQVASRGAISLAFEKLFAVPFGQEDVQRFRMTQVDLSEPDPDRRRFRVRVAAGTVALASLSGGLTLSGVALAKWLRADGASQVVIDRTNGELPRLNLMSAYFYGGAVLSGAVFAWATWWPSEGLTMSPLTAQDSAERGLMLEAKHRF
jgi:hypothetical protein